MSLEELIKKIKEIKESDSETKEKEILEQIAIFYINKFKVNKDEISFLFVDSEGFFLRFYYPSYLRDMGLLPVKFTESIATQVFNSGMPRIVNNVPASRHFPLFEAVKSDKGQALPIQKMIASPIITPEGRKIGVVEIMRKANRIDEVEDFTEADLDYLNVSISRLAPYIVEFADYKIKK
ncbi:MAG: GAF domain-containing protein [Candidatus Aminicenantia bacterium]